MKQFNLKEYLENPKEEVVTREGDPVRIICTDKKWDTECSHSGCSIVALVDFGFAELKEAFR